jgi:hypothetical protein
MKLDLKRLIKKYGGKWVALNNNSSRVLVSGKNAQKVYKEAKSKGSKTPKLYKVPRKYIPYIG